MMKKLAFKWFFSLAIVLSVTAILTSFSPAANATSVGNYEFRNNAASIQASGAPYRTTYNIHNVVTPRTGSTYVGRVEITAFSDSQWCRAIVTITTPNSVGGPIVSLPDQQGQVTAIPDDGDVVGADTPMCSADDARRLNGTVTVKGINVTNPGDPGEEVPAEKSIGVLFYNPEGIGGIGSDVRVTISRVNSNTVDDTKELVWRNDMYAGNYSDWKRDPGRYRICITPENISVNAGCKNVIKVKHKPLVVNFGSLADIPNPDGEKVLAIVRITVPPRNDSSQTTYGPLTVIISNSNNNQLGRGVTQTETPPFIDRDQEVNLRTEIDDVSATGAMRACIADTEFCTNFTKQANVRPTVIIPISAEDSAQLLDGADGEGGSLCQVESGLGWILCPVMNTVATLNDEAFEVIKRFLETPPLIIDGQPLNQNGVYLIWSYVRSIANVLFVMVFLFIIYSQITSMGVSNYGIKKMLPKLIVGAILVNTSFWIAAIAVDVSNVVGRSIYTTLAEIPREVISGNAELSGAQNFAGLTTMVLGGSLVLGIGVMVGLSVLLPLAVSAFFLLAGLMITLTFRHAMIFVLIAAAPLALLSSLMPNTDGFFKAWWKILKVLLLLYPAVAFIMGVSTIAGAVVFAGAQNISDPLTRAIMLFIGVAMPAMGVVAALMLAKTMGAIASRLGLQNPLTPAMNAVKNRAGSIGKGVDDAAKNRSKAAALSYASSNRGPGKSRFRRATAFAAGVAGGGVGDVLRTKGQKLESDYTSAKTVYDEEGGLGKLQAKDQKQMRTNRLIATSAQKATDFADNKELADKTDEELSGIANGSTEVFNALKQQRHSALMSVADSLNSELSNDQVAQIASTGKKLKRDSDGKVVLDADGKAQLDNDDASRAELAAAQIRIARTGSFQERHDALAHMAENKANFSEEARNVIAQEAIKRGDANVYGPAFGNELVKLDGSIKGSSGLADAAIKSAESGRISAEHMVQNAKSTEFIVDSVLRSGNQKAIDNVRNAADQSRLSPLTSGKVGADFEAAFQKIGSIPAQTPNQPPQTTPPTPAPAQANPSPRSQNQTSPPPPADSTGPRLRGGETTTDSGVIYPRNMN